MISPGHLVLPASQSSTKLHQLGQSCVQSSSEYLQMWYLWRQLLRGIYILLPVEWSFSPDTWSELAHCSMCFSWFCAALRRESSLYLSLQVVVANCSSNFPSTNLSLFSYAECSRPLTTLVALLWAPHCTSQIGDITVGVVSPACEQRAVLLTCWLCFCWQIPVCGHPSL